MGISDLPIDVVRFIDACIDSIEQLRVLLLLQEKPERRWTIPEISRELTSTEQSIHQRLDGLYSRNILTRDMADPDRHFFNVTSEKVRDVVENLRVVNLTKPYSVMEAVYAKPSRSLMAFVDAFKIGDKKSETRGDDS